jgi:hypothetical protein
MLMQFECQLRSQRLQGTQHLHWMSQLIVTSPNRVTSKAHRIALGVCCYDRTRTGGWGLNLTQPST